MEGGIQLVHLSPRCLVPFAVAQGVPSGLQLGQNGTCLLQVLCQTCQLPVLNALELLKSNGCLCVGTESYSHVKVNLFLMCCLQLIGALLYPVSCCAHPASQG